MSTEIPKPHTEAQSRAVRENHAHRSLACMKGMIASLHGVVPEAVLVTIRHATTRGIDHILAEQRARKRASLKSQLAKMDMLADPLGVDNIYAKELIK